MNSKQEINDLLKMYKMIGYKFPESFTDDMNHLFNYQTQHLIKHIEGMKKENTDFPSWIYHRYRGYNQALQDILDYLRK